MKNQRLILHAEENSLNHELLQRTVEIMLSSAAGVVTFPAVLGLLQRLVWKPIGVAAHMRFAPLCGFMSLSAASACSALAFDFVRRSATDEPGPPLFAINGKESLVDIMPYGALCFLTFKFFGGRLRSLLPSHILYPGAFAVESVALPSVAAPATKARLNTIQVIGKKHGCHTCGKKYSFIELLASKLWKRLLGRPADKITVNYFADHNPPVALAEEFMRKNKSVGGRLYPQCKSCSYFQASQVRLHQQGRLKNKSAIVTHVSRFRLHKLWLPFPVLFQYGLFQLQLKH